jgi:GT2 family glycosyltransferase
VTEQSVSLVVASFNGRDHLETLLNALANQTFPHERLELIVVDNGSTDGTVEFLRKQYPAVRVIENAQNVGFATSCNQGAVVARGRHLALLNNDMSPEPHWLDRMVDALESSPPDVVCVGSRIENWEGTRVDFVGGGVSFNGMGYQDGHGATVGSEEEPVPSERLLFACGGAMLIDRDVFLNVGGFDERFFAFYEDVDLGWRLWVLGYEVGFCSDAVVYHRGGATGRRLPEYRKLALLERNALYTVLKNYDDEALAAVWPAALLLAVKRIVVRALVPRAPFDLVPDGPVTETRPIRQLANRAATVARVARQDGVREAFGRALIAFGRAALGHSGDARPTALMPLDAYAGLVAIDDVVGELPGLLETRRWIQERRRRSDREIFRLFPPRFVPESNHPIYTAAFRTVVNAFGVPAAVGAEWQRVE